MDCKRWVLIASGSLVAMGATPVIAAEPGFYVAATVGHAEENPGASDGIAVIPAPFGSITQVFPERVEVDSGDVAWGAAIGYRINRYVAAKVEYMDLGTATVSEDYFLAAPGPFFPPGLLQFTRRYTSKISGPALSVLGSLPLGDSFDLFLRGGVFFADRKIGGADGNTFGDTVWLGGVGASWSFASRWTLRAEYQRTGETDSHAFAAATDTERASLSILFRL